MFVKSIIPLKLTGRSANQFSLSSFAGKLAQQFQLERIMSRLEHKAYADLSPEQQATFDNIVENRPVKPKNDLIGGPFDVWLRSPEMGKRLVDLGGFFRFRSHVERRYIELAILVTGHFWQAQFEWYAHEPMAREAGVPESVISAIKAGQLPDFQADPDANSADEAVYNLASELHHHRKLSADTFDQAKQAFGETGVSELIGLCGFYGLVSMTLNGFEVPLPEGAQNPFS